MATLITQKAYARKRRITPQYVNKLVSQGKIRLKNGLVDPVQADEARTPQRPSAIRPRHKGSNAHGGGRPPRQRSAPAAGDDAGEFSPAPTSAMASLTRARAADAGFSARLRQLDLLERTKQLLPAQEVLEAQRRVYANIRLRFRGLARAMAPALARIGTPAEVERLLLEEIDHQLEELAQDPLASVGPAAAAPEPGPVQTPAGATA